MKCAWIAAAVVSLASTVWGQTQVTFEIDAKRDVHPISRYIYGVNQFHLNFDGLDGAYSNLCFTRLGGNRLTAYNWVTNASQAGSDWHFQNDDYLVTGPMFEGLQDVPGGAVIPIAKLASERGAALLLTIPINGLVAADKPEKARKGAAFSLKPDPAEPVVYQDEFVNWVKTTFPYAETDAGRPIWFSLDNEPDWWSHTHKEIHPAPVTYAELMEKSVDYASAAKDVMPGTLIFGPANYGWQGYVRLQEAVDAADRDFQVFYLKQMAAAEQKYGKRLLDVLDVHWYPESRSAKGVRITMGPGEHDGSAEVAAVRVQAPRSLWDLTYTEETWITQSQLHGPVALIPRLKAKIAEAYPGTKLAITEYNFGGGADISGAIAQADVLGIFGREGVFAAALWAGKDVPFLGAAFECYRNFDGKKGVFGDVSVYAGTSDVEGSSVYASVDSAGGGRMVVVAINKTDHELTGVFKLSGVEVKHGQVYRVTGAGPKVVDAGTVAVEGGGFTYRLPALSVSTVELRP